MKLKKVKTNEVPRALHKAIFGSSAEWDERKNSQYWVMYDENKDPVGFCSCYGLQTDRDTIFLSRAGLLPSAQGKGLGRKLIEARLKWGKRNGYKYAITYTNNENAQSFANLQKCGFALYVPEVKYAGNGFLYFYAEL
jgi:GNAT superfamily N-acetyltransferase